MATAYRRFANKEEVIDALFEQRLQAIADAATEALEDPDPWHGLVDFLERSLDMQFGDRGLNQIMNNPQLGDARVSDARDRIAPLIARLSSAPSRPARSGPTSTRRTWSSSSSVCRRSCTAAGRSHRSTTAAT